jgi:phage virion morphogenesis protein
MVTLTVSLDSLDFDRAIANGLRELSDLTDLMERIGTNLEASVSERFERGTGPGGIAWPVSKRARDEGGRTLVRDGHLRDSTVSEADATSARVGTNIVYAATHQFGAEAGEFGAAIGLDKNGRRFFTPIPWGDVPARPFIGFDEADEADIGDTVEAWLREVMA